MPDKFVCSLGNRVLFELTHGVGDNFKASAELYTPDGCFVKCTDAPKPELFDLAGNEITRVGGVIFSGCTFMNLSVGIWLHKNGDLAIAVK